MDVELYLPEDWFTVDKAGLIEKFGIPAELKFKTRIEPGGEMIQRAHARGTTYLSGAKNSPQSHAEIKRKEYFRMLYRNARKNANMTLSN